VSDGLGVRVEVWPLAADAAGIWLIGGTEPWRSEPVPSAGDPHLAVTGLLAEHRVLDAAGLVHSTSWRVDRDDVVLTYLSVLRSSRRVRDDWPLAMSVRPEVVDSVGRPWASEPLEPPVPRPIDVLLHGLRHLRFLLDSDAGVRSALDETWRLHLEEFEPTLARMYT